MAEVSYLHLHEDDEDWSPDLDGFDVSESDLDLHPTVHCSCHHQRLTYWNPTRITSNSIGHENQVIMESDVVGSDCGDVDLNDLETDFGLGLGIGFAMEECNYDGEDDIDDDDIDGGFMVADSGDEFIVSGTERGDGDLSETYFMGGISLVDSDEDHEDGVIGVDDDFDINVGCDDEVDDEGTLTLCWDAFRLEDDDEDDDDRRIVWDVPVPAPLRQQFEWEEVDGDVREVLNISPDAEPEADNWEVFLNSHNLETNPANDVGWEVFLNVGDLDGNPDLEDQFEDYNDAEHDMLFGQFADNVDSALVQPPASKKAVDNLLSVVMTVKDHENNNAHCAVCKDEIDVGEMAKQLPCTHHYHGDCIVPWLCIRNTCPVCRHELPTDDPGYERRKAERAASHI